MRGEVLSFDAASGTGWIGGQDGLRYSFTTANLAAPVPAHPGSPLDFTPVGMVATRIMPAPGSAIPGAAPGSAPGAAPRSSGLFSPVTPDPVGEPELLSWAYATRCMLRKYADFNGRARRKEYWSFILFELLVILPLYIVTFVLFGLGSATTSQGDATTTASADPANAALLVIGLALLLILLVIGLVRTVPSYAVLARRLHDVGLSAWWILAAFVPIGSLILFVVTFMPSQPGKNIYGGYPKPGGASPPLPQQAYAPPPPQPMA